jgi:hypothetical protein
MNTETSDPKATIFATEALPTGKEVSPWENDIFGYQEFGETLGKYFENIPSLRVVLLDGDWGTGKSFFAKQWEAYMRQKGGFELVYIDAFANDFQLDPFSLVTSAILNIEKDEGSQLQEKATALLKSMAFNLMGKLSAEIVEGEQVEDLLFPKQDIVDQFKSCLKELAEKKRLIVIIDELDRCRPDFALEMIERVKHIFDVPNVQFLLVSNRKQLAKMVSKSYGLESDDAQTYLDKFFALPPFNLPRGEISSAEIYARKLLAQQSSLSGYSNEPRTQAQIRRLIEFLSQYAFTLRDIEKIFAVVSCVSFPRSLSEETFVMLFPLAFLRVKHKDLYQRYWNDGYVWKDLADKYNFQERVGKNLGSRELPQEQVDLNDFVSLLHVLFEKEEEVEKLYKKIEEGTGEQPRAPIPFFRQAAWNANRLSEISKHQFVQRFMKEIDSLAGLFDNS